MCLSEAKGMDIKMEKKFEIITTIRRDKQQMENQKLFLERVQALLEMQVTKFRFNIEKWEDKERDILVSDIQEIRKKFHDIPFKVFLDIPYPNRKIRIATKNKENILLRKGERLHIFSNECDIDKCNIGIRVNIKNVGDMMWEQQKIIFGDGVGCLEVEEIRSCNEIIARADNTFELEHSKAITFTGSVYQNMDQLEQIIQLIEQIKPEGVALSFVENEKQIENFRRKLGFQCEIMAKIESKEGVNRYKEILEKADSIMIARGDLGLAIPIHKLAQTQILLIEEAKKQNKPVYVATDVLNSMMKALIPTRADIMDLYLIKESGATGVVLTYGLVRSNQIQRAVKLIKDISVNGKN